MDAAKEFGCGNSRAVQLGMARRAEVQTCRLAKDIKTLTRWLRRDVLTLAGPCLATRVELFDFVTAELVAREHLDSKRIRPVRIALQNQRDDLLAFAGVLDGKLDAIAQDHDLPMYLVRQTCLLQRKPDTSPPYLAGLVPTVRPDGAQVSCRLLGRDTGHGANASLQLNGGELQFQAAQLFHVAPPTSR